jgi:hypothetical protein
LEVADSIEQTPYSLVLRERAEKKMKSEQMEMEIDQEAKKDVQVKQTNGT